MSLVKPTKMSLNLLKNSVLKFLFLLLGALFVKLATIFIAISIVSLCQ